MMEDISTIWNTGFSTAGGISITVGDVVLTLALVFGGYAVSKIAEKGLERRLQGTKLKADSVSIIKRIVFYVILAFVVFTILGLLGIPLTAFAFATGAIAIGIGFGAQNIINNFISGWILMAERPIRVNDYIEVDGYAGTVQRVGTRSTMIHRLDGVRVLIPNSKLLENTVVNWTLLDGMIRHSVKVGVAYGSDIEVTKQAIRAAVGQVDSILAQPEADIVFEDFGDSALIFEVFIWNDINTGRPLRMVRSDLRTAIAKEFATQGIVIAFPQRDLHLSTDKALEISLSNVK